MDTTESELVWPSALAMRPCRLVFPPNLSRYVPEDVEDGARAPPPVDGDIFENWPTILTDPASSTDTASSTDPADAGVRTPPSCEVLLPARSLLVRSYNFSDTGPVVSTDADSAGDFFENWPASSIDLNVDNGTNSGTRFAQQAHS